MKTKLILKYFEKLKQILKLRRKVKLFFSQAYSLYIDIIIAELGTLPQVLLCQALA